VCGRVVAKTPLPELARQFRAELAFQTPNGRPPEPSWNVAPTDLLPAVLESRSRHTRLIGELKWGLVPHWAKDPSTGYRMINARAETLTTKAAYRDAFTRHRCVIPVDAFYEWQRVHGRRKQPYVIEREDGQPLSFAGLWALWRPRNDPEAEPLRTCTIVTTEANDLVQPLHDRMPVILPRATWNEWLDPNNDDVEGLQRLLRPPVSRGLVAYPVSPMVNSVDNDGPQLVEPMPQAG
jgi:putative SOS response-associated peptidase YedK